TAATLFAPREAIRARLGGGRGGFGGGQAPASGQAQFPGNGATINYYLSHAASDRVSIDILDQNGKTIRSFSNQADTRQAADGPAPSADDEEGGGFRRAAPPVRLTTVAGMNRLNWDFNNAAGFMVPPGTYRVKMTVGTWSDVQPIALKADPRLAVDG